MKYNKTGNSGLKLPEISLGLWHNFGDTASYENMRKLCKIAFDNGITHFDLANNYGPPAGSAEINFGRILKEVFGNNRDEMIITTKAGYSMWDGVYGDGGSRKHIIASADQSLARLQLSYVDIFYHHRPDKETPLEESMLALDSIVKQGKAIYVGLSNYKGEDMVAAYNILRELRCPFIINQNNYSMLNLNIEENGLKQRAKDLGLGIIAFSPLAQGVLTDRYINGIPSDSRINTDGRFLKSGRITEELRDGILKLNKIASDRGQTLAQMALSWVLKDEEVTSVLIGASKSEQILDNLKILERPNFCEEELGLISKITKVIDY